MLSLQYANLANCYYPIWPKICYKLLYAEYYEVVFQVIYTSWTPHTIIGNMVLSLQISDDNYISQLVLLKIAASLIFIM